MIYGLNKVKKHQNIIISVFAVISSMVLIVKKNN